MRLMILGAGFSGLAIARALAADCDFAGGTTRGGQRFEALRSAGLAPFLFSEDAPKDGLDRDLAEELARTTHLIMSIAPGADGDPVLKSFSDDPAAAMPRLEWIGYLSTVGVYGNHDGAWVDEDAQCRPVSQRSIARMTAEQDWTLLAAGIDVPLAILRLSGIYGPGRNALMTLHAGKARRLIKPGQVFNRIHVDDIGGAAARLSRARQGGIFNITDDRPAPPQDVVCHAARLMGVTPPPETDFDTADLSPMARSFYGENKRVSNARIKAAGYNFIHPDYESGLGTLWDGGSWRG